MSRGASEPARRRAALALLTLACLAPLPSARGAVHAYGHDAFERVGDASLFYAGREGMLRGTATRATTGETLRGVNDGRSYVQLDDVVFVRGEEAAARHAGASADAVTGAVEAIFFEAGDARRVGVAATDGSRAMCCDAAAAASLGCAEGRVAVAPLGEGEDGSSGNDTNTVWTARAAFYGARREARFAPDAREQKSQPLSRVARDVARDGMYELLFVSCDDVVVADDPSRALGLYSVTGRSVWKNPEGYLPGRKRHDRAVYGFAAAAYATTAAAWTTATASKIFAKDAVHFVHVAVFGVLLLGMAEYLARYANAAQFNETGTKPVAGVVFAALLSAAREACSRAGVYLASLGWGITRQSLGDAEMSRTKLLAGLYFACSLVLELDAQRVLVASDAGAWRVGAGADAHDDVETSAHEFLALPVFALDATFAAATLTALTKTLAKLQARRQHAKLALYTQFTECIAILIVVSFAWQAFSTFLAVADGVAAFRPLKTLAPYWEWEWSARAGWIAIEVGVTVATCVLWRPSSAPERYAYRELEDTSSAFARGEGDERSERSGDGEGLTKNAARGARKPKTAFHGLMAGTPGRGVALEQTPIRRGGFDDTSSDEEAKME